MAVNFKDYTTMRDIAQKRIKRAQAKGIDLNIVVPTVKELRQRGEMAQEIAFMQLQQFLSTGFSLKRERERARPKMTEEQRKERRRQQSREYRRRKVAREHELESHPTKYQEYLKGLKTLGVDIAPSKLPGFFAYMDFRFAQGQKGGQQYVFDIFVEDYVRMLEKGYKSDQILADFNKFAADQAMISARANNMQGMSYEHSISLWDKFIGSDK